MTSGFAEEDVGGDARLMVAEAKTTSIRHDQGRQLSTSLKLAVDEALKKHPAVIIGEDHSDSTVKRDLAAAIPKLQITVTHLGLEALPADAQSLVDDYFNTRGEDAALADKVAAVLKEHFLFFNCSGYMDIIRAATKAGIAIVALDLPDNEQTNIHGASPSTLNDDKERFMAKRIIGVLSASPSAKLLILTGWGHARMDRLPKKILEESGAVVPGIAALPMKELAELSAADKNGFSVLVELTATPSIPKN